MVEGRGGGVSAMSGRSGVASVVGAAAGMDLAGTAGAPLGRSGLGGVASDRMFTCRDMEALTTGTPTDGPHTGCTISMGAVRPRNSQTRLELAPHQSRPPVPQRIPYPRQSGPDQAHDPRQGAALRRFTLRRLLSIIPFGPLVSAIDIPEVFDPLAFLGSVLEQPRQGADHLVPPQSVDPR